MSIGYRIYKNNKKEIKEVLKELQDIPVANLGDAANRLICTNGHVHSMNGLRAVGKAYTVKVPDGDNLLFYYAIENAKPGDIIVVSGNGFEERALCGEIMATYARKRNLAGFIVDGAIRDIKDIRLLDFPVFARAVCPNGPYKNGPGEINVPVVIDGKIICPGDVIVADEEGIAVIKPNDVRNIIDEAKKVMKKEAKMLQQIKDTSSLDLKWVYEKLKETKCEIIDNQREDQEDER